MAVKKNIIFLCVLVIMLMSVPSALAAASSLTQGPKTASSATGVDDGNSATVAWTAAGNALISDNVYAGSNISGGQTSELIQLTAFNFNIPSGVTIDGITVGIERQKTTGGGGGTFKDSVVKLVKGGSVVGDNKSTSTAWTNSDVNESHGSSSDLWGTSWTSSDINDANFGVAISVNRDSGNSARNASIDSVTVTVTYHDTTAPVITLSGSTPVTLEAGSSYNDAGATANDNIDGTLTSSIVTVNPVNANVPGTYTVTYNVVDAAGNAATQVTRTVTVVDTTAPVIALKGLSPVTIQFGSVYNDAGATAFDLADGNLTNSIVTVNTVNTSALGTYTVTYNVADAAGNAATQVTRTVNVVDTTAPTSTLSAGEPSFESDGTLFVTSSTVFTLTAADAGSGVNSLTYQIDSGDEVSVNSGDTFTLEGLSGSHTITHWAADAAGNEEDAVEESIFIDESAPITSAETDEINGDNGWYVGLTAEPQIHLSCSDASGSGVSELSYQWDTDDEATTDADSSVNIDIDLAGTHTLSFFCVDNLGNEEETQTIENIKYDDDVPTTDVEVSPSEPSSGWYVSEVTVTLTCTDDTSGCDLNGVPETVFASLDDSEFTEVTEPVIVESDGVHTLQYYSQDVAGNSEETQTLTVKIDSTQATTDFSITPEVPDGDNDFYVSDATITLTCVDDGSGCESTVFYSWDEEEGDYTDGGSSVELSTEDLEDGAHTLYYYSEDEAGNAGTVAAFNIKLDRTTPGLSENGVTATSPTTIKVQFSEDINDDNLALNNFRLFSNRATDEVVVTELTGEIALESVSEKDGVVTLTLSEELQDGDQPTLVINTNSDGEERITDLAGNEYDTSDDEQDVLDVITPVVTIEHNVFLTNVDEEVTFTASASDVFSGLDEVDWDFGDASDATGTEVTHTYSTEGAYDITAVAHDLEGNEASATATAVVGQTSLTFDEAPDVSVKFVNVPADAVNLTVEQKNTTNVSTSGFLVGGKFYTIESDLVDGTFNITLTFSYEDADANGVVDGTTINEGDLNVQFFNEATSAWVVVPNPVRNAAANTLTVTVDHFTLFALLASVPAAPAASSNSGGGGGGGGRTSRSVNPIAPLPKKAAPQAKAAATAATVNSVPSATVPAQAAPVVQNTPSPLSGQAVANVGRSSKSIAVAVGAIILIGGLGVWQYRKRKLA